MASQNTWFVMIPPGYASKSTAEKELVDFVIQFQPGTQAYDDASAGKILSAAEGSTGNPQVPEQLVKWLGPYATEADAKAAANPQQQSVNPLNDATNAAENSSTIGGSLAAVNNFLGDLTQRNLWLRVLKIVGGLSLAIIGIVHLSGGRITSAAGAAKWVLA